MSILIEATENGTLTLEVKVTDAYGVAVTPTAAVYTVTNRDGDVINSQSDVAITPLGESMIVNLADDDLLIEDQTNDREYRLFTVETDRGSALLPETIETPFWVKNLKVIT